MRLKINHTTRYNYDVPAHYGLQHIRLRPLASGGQKILSWDLFLTGASSQAQFTDQFGNHVDLILLDKDVHNVEITFSGEVETSATAGIEGTHTEMMPLWFYLRQTALTQAGAGVQALVKQAGSPKPNDLASLHDLSRNIIKDVAYETGTTGVTTTAEQALKAGSGVCQDHTHIFLSAARALGFPARYISGYLMMNDRIDQDASHAWAEAYVQDLGWVGFDISNGISPDERYVKIARGLDYNDAAPSSGVIIGGQTENMIVSIQVQQ